MENARLTCPGCGAPVKVDLTSRRTLTCQYCGSDFEVPDSVWQSLEQTRNEYASRERSRQEEAEEVQAAIREEGLWKSWMRQMKILMGLNVVLTFFVMLSASNGALDAVWAFFFLGSTIYLAVRRPKLLSYDAGSTFARGARWTVYLKLVGIKWLLAVFVSGVAQMI